LKNSILVNFCNLTTIGEIFHFYLEPDGRLSHDHYDVKDIQEIPIDAFYRPQEIIDKFLEAIQEGAEYRKEQFKEIEMAKTIIDAITKTTLSNSKKEEEKMTVGKLLVLNDWIDTISEANAGNKRLQKKLLRLKTCAMLTDESLRSDVGPGW